MLKAANHFQYIMIFLLSVYISISDVDAATIKAASCSRSDVGSAISSSTYGDTVVVPAGNCAWGSSISLNRGLTVKGAGIGNTVITTTSNTLFYVYPSSAAVTNDETFEISGFSFIGTGSAATYGLITIDNVNNGFLNNVIIHDNRFYGSTSDLLSTYGNVNGVAYNNIFDNYYTLNFLGNGYQSWDYPLVYGTAGNFYVEDNTFIVTEAECPLWIESGQGGRYLLRYNDIDLSNCNAWIDLWDIHGDQGYAGGMGGEIYGNSVINATGGATANRWMAHRGGQLLMFYNKWQATGGNVGIDIQENHACTAQTVTNTYYWSNYFNTKLVNGTEDNDPNNCIAENSEFYNLNVSFDGTTGMGCGTLGSRPATCTTGVGYWATDQSCSDLTNHIGKNPTTPISGTLYKCTATDTWTSYYTPYTYPHPLRTGITVTLAPAAPTNLRLK